MKLLPIRQNLGPEVNPSIEFVPSFNLSNELIDSIKLRLVTCNKINTVGSGFFWILNAATGF